jgi:hypothetical protein
VHGFESFAGLVKALSLAPPCPTAGSDL